MFSDILERYSRHIPFLDNDSSQAIEKQSDLQKARVLLAGCGVGSNVVRSLAGYGMGSASDSFIIFADPDIVEEGNLNRQDFEESNIGENKAVACAQRIKRLNSDINTFVVPEGITLENVNSLVERSTIVVDMIDIGVPDVMYALHNAAKHYKKPVVTGLDLGFGIITYVFAYNKLHAMGLREFLGFPNNTSPKDVKTLNSLGVAAQFVLGASKRKFPNIATAKTYYENLILKKNKSMLFSKLPEEMRNAMHMLQERKISFIPQDGSSAQVLGAQIGSIVRDIILLKEIVSAPQKVEYDLRRHVIKGQ